MRTMLVRSAGDLGAAVAEARRLRGLTQEQLARQSGIDRTYLARIEAGASVLLLNRSLKLLRRLGAEVIVNLPESAARKDASATAEEGELGDGHP